MGDLAHSLLVCFEKTRGSARQEVFDYIEMFCNPTRKHEQRHAVAS